MAKPTQADAEAAVRVLIEWAGDDPSREGLLRTPERVEKAYRFLTSGYSAEIDRVLEEAADRYGPLPDSVLNLADYGRIRVMADRLRIESIDREARTVVFDRAELAVVVRLDEGVFLVSALVDCPIEDLAVGARVEVAITEADTDLTLPLFRRSEREVRS